MSIDISQKEVQSEIEQESFASYQCGALGSVVECSDRRRPGHWSEFHPRYLSDLPLSGEQALLATTCLPVCIASFKMARLVRLGVSTALFRSYTLFRTRHTKPTHW